MYIRTEAINKASYKVMLNYNKIKIGILDLRPTKRENYFVPVDTFPALKVAHETMRFENLPLPSSCNIQFIIIPRSTTIKFAIRVTRIQVARPKENPRVFRVLTPPFLPRVIIPRTSLCDCYYRTYNATSLYVQFAHARVISAHTTV